MKTGAIGFSMTSSPNAPSPPSQTFTSHRLGDISSFYEVTKSGDFRDTSEKETREITHDGTERRVADVTQASYAANTSRPHV